jgi:hypothetical protein
MWGELGYFTRELREKLKKEWLEMLAAPKPSYVRGDWVYVTGHIGQTRLFPRGILAVVEEDTGEFVRCIYNGGVYNFHKIYVEALTDVKYHELSFSDEYHATYGKSTTKDCACTIDVLMSQGCQCGGV